MPRNRFAYLLVLLLASTWVADAWSSVTAESLEDARIAADDDYLPPSTQQCPKHGAESDHPLPGGPGGWVASLPAARSIWVAALTGLRAPFAVPLLYLLMSLQR